jgi:hypothetical protein
MGESKLRVKEGEYGGCIFVFMYEARTMKPKKEGEVMKENNGKGESN